MHKLMNLEAAPRRKQRSFHTLPARSIPNASPVSGRYFRQQLLTSLPLAAADFLTLAACVGIVSLLVGSTGVSLLGLLPFLAVSLIVVNFFQGLYPAVGFHPAEELRLCSISTSAVAVTAIALSLATSAGISLIGAAVMIWIGLLIVIPLSRSAMRILVARFDYWAQPVLIIGEIDEAKKLIREMETNRTSGLRPLGIITHPRAQWRNEDLADIDALCIGTLEEAASIAALEGVFWAIIISSGAAEFDQHDVESYLHNIPHRLYTFEEQHQSGYENILAESASFHS